MSMRRLVFRFLGLGLKILISLIFLLLTATLCLKAVEPLQAKPLGKSVPLKFPVLIIWQENQKYNAKIVYYEELPGFTANLPRFSYLVPVSQEKKLNEFIFSNSRAVDDPTNYDAKSPEPWLARFKVEKNLPDGSQLIRAELTNDVHWTNIGWYRAAANSFVPQKQLAYFGPDLALKVLPFAFIIALGLGHLLNSAIKKLDSGSSS